MLEEMLGEGRANQVRACEMRERLLDNLRVS